MFTIVGVGILAVTCQIQPSEGASFLRGELAKEIPSQSWGTGIVREKHTERRLTEKTVGQTGALSFFQTAMAKAHNADPAAVMSELMIDSVARKPETMLIAMASVTFIAAVVFVIQAIWGAISTKKRHFKDDKTAAPIDSTKDRNLCQSLNDLSALSSLSEHEIMVLQEISKLPRLTMDDISPPRAPYDCAFVRPQEEHALVRLQGRVCALSSPARSPVAGEHCAMFTTCAAELRVDGIQAPPVSFYSIGADFELELTASGDRVSERVRVSGSQVGLSAMVDGRSYRVTLFGDCSPEIQDLVKGQFGKPGGAELNESTVLELTESCLRIDAEITCVGKLLRAPTGQLHLLPPDINAGRECCPGQFVTACGNIFVSDNPFLLRTASDAGKEEATEPAKE